MFNLFRRTAALILSLALLAAGTAYAAAGTVVGVSLSPAAESVAAGPLGQALAAGTAISLDGGLYALPGADGVNRLGLFDETGAQLLPFEAALIRRLNDRYLTVYYALEETEDKNEAILFVPSGSGNWIAGNVPKDGDLMYTGYARFYDTTAQAFVGELRALERNASSGRLLVLRGKGAQPEGVYDETGALVHDSARWTAGPGYLIKPSTEVYDESLTLRYTSDTRLESFPADAPYLKQMVEDGCRVIDPDGHVVLAGPFKMVFEEALNLFSVQRPDGSYALMRADGVELAAGTERFLPLAPGYYYGKDAEGYMLVYPGGVIARGLEYRPEPSLQVCRREPDGERTLALGPGAWTVPLKSHAWSLGPGLAMEKRGWDAPYDVTVYNLFSGEIALQGEYDDVTRTGAFIAARRGETVALYHVDEQTAP